MDTAKEGLWIGRLFNKLDFSAYIEATLGTKPEQSCYLALRLPKSLDSVPGLPGLNEEEHPTIAIDRKKVEDVVRGFTTEQGIEYGAVIAGVAMIARHLEHLTNALKGEQFTSETPFFQGLEGPDFVVGQKAPTEHDAHELRIGMFLTGVTFTGFIRRDTLKIQLPAFLADLKIPQGPQHDPHWARGFQEFRDGIEAKGVQDDGRVACLVQGLSDMDLYLKGAIHNMIEYLEPPPPVH